MSMNYSYGTSSDGIHVARMSAVHPDVKNGCGVPPSRKPQVMEYIESLEKAIAENDDLIRTLTERLACVVSPKPCSGGDGPPKDCLPAAPLASLLGMLADRVGNANDQLRYLLGAIEI